MTFWEFIASVAWPLVILFIVLMNWTSFRSLFGNLSNLAGRASEEASELAVGAFSVSFRERIKTSDIPEKEKVLQVVDETLEEIALSSGRRKPRVKALVNWFHNASPAPFTGIEIPLPSGHKIVMQLRSQEGWISSTDPKFQVEEDPALQSAGLSQQGSGWRFDIR